MVIAEEHEDERMLAVVAAVLVRTECSVECCQLVQQVKPLLYSE